MIESKEYQKICKIALLVSISCVLQIAESLIPHPIPGLRLGLANVMVLVALITLDFKAALEVAILRTVLSSFIMGTFMSPAFILSFSAALVSTLVMGFFYWLVRIQKHFHLSIVGISILGALSHNLVQLYIAYLMLVRHKGIFVFLPWLSIGALVMGWVTGVIAGNICRKLKEFHTAKTTDEKFKVDHFAWEFRHYLPGNSFLHRISAQTKIISLFVLSLSVLIFSNLWFYATLSLFLVAFVLMSGTSFDFFFLRIRKYTLLVFLSFIFPLFFNSGRHVLSHIAYFNITSEGLSTGVVFAFRIIFLILLSSLLVRTTSPGDLINGLTKALSPLKFFGISQERIAVIFSLSWMAIPVLWERTRNAIRAADLKKIRNLRNLIPILSNLIATLYLEADEVNAV